MSDSLPRVAVVMAIYRPAIDRLKKQIETIISQESVLPHLFIFADGPMPECDEVSRIADRHARMTFVQFPENRGPAQTFLEGLAQVHGSQWANDRQPFFAFADQDDLWDRDKLAANIAELQRTGAHAVHSDARLIDGTSDQIESSLFRFERRDLDPSLVSLFFRNTVTGMTMMLDHDLAGAVTRFRELRPTGWLHDHFAAVVAKAANGIAFIDRPLVSYVQHGGNVVGAKAPARRLAAKGDFLRTASPSGRYIAEGAEFVRALLSSDWPGETGRHELTKLREVLDRRGPAGLVHAAKVLHEQNAGTRALKARLFWSKLFPG